MDLNKLTLESLLLQLLQEELIDKDQQAEARLKASRYAGAHPITQVGELSLIATNKPSLKLTSEYLTEWYANKVQIAYLRLDPLKIDVDAVASVMSLKFAERHNILAVKIDNKKLIIATSRPDQQDWVKDLSHVTKKVIQLVISEPAAIKRFTKEFYTLSLSVKHASKTEFGGKSSVGNLEQLVELGKMGEADANDKHIVRVVDWILTYAFEQRASDIHIEPRRDKGFIRFRIDGVLHNVHDLPIDITKAVISRLKILGRMDVAEKRRPLDGRIKTKDLQGEEIELRLSTMPTAFGEKFVGRIFDPTVLLRDFNELGMNAQDKAQWHSLIKQPTGIVLVTGPTGSGKTTTLYTSLKLMATSEVNVCTLEDPIEMVEPSFNQMQVNHDIGLDFASGIRSLLRQDPDIIMVGEIRDAETAEMAVQAALTGHLVISTLHTNDAPLAITRMLEIGVPGYLINATLLGVMAQRLVRVLCANCKVETNISEHDWANFIKPFDLPYPQVTYKAKGCDECRNSGFKGRAGLYEMLMVDKTTRALIRDEADATQIRQAGIDEGMRVLRISGALKVAEGVTTIEEVLRVAPQNDDR
ncbi:MAG: type II secretion system protein E [Gammaproteobacteria bacterium]|nr:MAG: type II secretion system protein E [Gammaproteobacteria bacterium]